MGKSKRNQQDEIKQLLVHLAGDVMDGKYGKNNNIDAPAFIEDAEELLDDLKEVVGYGN